MRMMLEYKKNGVWGVLGAVFAMAAICLNSCTPSVDNPTMVDRQPRIYPDYIGVTIPADIAPMNFNIKGDTVDVVDVVAKGSKGGELHVSGEWADFDVEEWHRLTRQNIGGSISFTVSTLKDGEWKQYKDFKMTVSAYSLDDYGLTYRRIAPGYEVGGDIGIYQRDIHTFEETPIMTETALPGRCFNCHTANRTDPRQVTAQIRGEGGGTLVMKDGRQQWLDTKTDSTKAAGSYAYWHPDGNYVAYAANAVHQSFFVGTYKPIEVYHDFSNIVMLDTRNNQLVTDPKLMTPDWLEIFPAFSADGKTLYYSTSKSCRVPAEYLKVKCSLVSIPFDANTGTFGEKVDTLLNGLKTHMSYVLARPSYDGKWLMYTRCSRSNFPIVQPDADLWLMNLKTRETHPLKAVNSSKSESYHNWSSNSRWFVFSSKRGDGNYTRLYLSSIDDKGNATKPFLLPQRNPWKYYHGLFDAYNVPDFTKTKVNLDIRETRNQIFSNERPKVRLR